MATEALLEKMGGVVGERPNQWTSTSGPSRLGVTVGDTFFASSMTPRTSPDPADEIETGTVYQTRFQLPVDGDTTPEYGIDDSAYGHQHNEWDGASIIALSTDMGDYVANIGGAFGDGIFVTPRADEFQFGSGDFSIEFFVRRDDSADNDFPLAVWDTSSARSWAFRTESSGAWSFFISSNGSSSSQVFANVSGMPQDSDFHHIVVCREGTTMSAYADGVRVGTVTDSTSLFASGADLAIGNLSSETNPMDCAITGIRIIKGSSPYDPTSATLTVPTEYYPAELPGTCFGYDTGGSGTESVDEFRRDFTTAELTAISGGSADMTVTVWAAKDSTIDDDTGRIGIEFFNSSDVSLGAISWTPATNYQDEFGTATWGEVTLTEGIPTTAAYAIIYLAADPVGSGSTPNVFWDDISSEIASTAETDTRATQVIRRTLAKVDAEVRATQAVRRVMANQGATTRATQVFRRTLAVGLPCVTQRAMMWSIERRDGQGFYFTSHDRDIVWREQTYKSCDSLMNTAAEASAMIGDIGDVALKGIISDDSISEEDLFGGLFDDAFVEVWIYDWGQGRLTPKRIAAGWIGEVSHGEDGVDLSVLTMGARLEQQSVTTPIQPGCRWIFGSTECGVDLESLKLTGTVTSVASRISFTANLSGGDGGLQWKNGTVLWTYGNNDELVSEVKEVTFQSGSDEVLLWTPVPLAIEVGDTFDLRPGCDKAFDGGCTVYNNKVNFGGFPDVPGNDEMTKTPNAKA